MSGPKPPHDEQPATPGAQRQIDEIRSKMHNGLRAMIVAVALIGVGFAVTGWQVVEAFNQQESERRDRVGALASINTFLCQRIDNVGDGVAALVAVNLRQAPAEDELTPGQRTALRQFKQYVEQQERPPRCRELALKVATLTGADPGDVQITPIRLHPGKAQNSRSDASSANP